MRQAREKAAQPAPRPAPSFNLPLVGLILLATWLRLWQLGSIPPGLWFDEGLNGMEAVWMLKTRVWPVFILTGQGREVLFHYLLALSIAVLGETIYAIRLVPAFLGILSIPLMYRWVLTLFKGEPAARWIALLSATGLTVSFWYLVMNRVGYRANTLLPVMLLTCYFFWRGWQTGKFRYYLIAGLGLGLGQYTYLAGRLVPLVFILFLAGQTLLGWQKERARLKTAWSGLLVMVGVAVLVFLPMLLFFVDYPELFWERGGDVSLKIDWQEEGWPTLARNLVAAGRVFVDGQDPNWRHHLPGRPVLDWFGTLGFWVGLLVVIRHYRRPVHLFLLSMLLVMWLPAPLSEPAFHTLRLVGVLPAYYVLVAVGLINIVNWLGQWVRRPSGVAGPLRPYGTGYGPMVALVALLLLSGGSTLYDYFYRWARLPEVYQAFDGPVVDLAGYLASGQAGSNVVIPFYLYTHASMRYMLQPHFQEEVLLPGDVSRDLSQPEKVTVIFPEYPADDHLPPALVWLVKAGTGPGTAYVSSVQRDVSLAQLATQPVEVIEGSRNQVIARRYEIDSQELLALFPPQLPQKKVAATWADNLRLSGYEFVPGVIEAGGMSHLYLSWQILGYTGLPAKMFLQLLDRQGNPVGQAELEPISRKMYRWRDDGLILEQHPLKFDPDLETGLYFARLGFFNPKTNQRLPVYDPNNQPLGDELIVGPLYVATNQTRPVNPQHPLQVRLGETIELLGYSVRAWDEHSTEVELYWKAHALVDINYTVFVQLLDPQHQVIAQADAQPLANLYPTSRWQPGDLLSEKFVLPVSIDELSGENRLVTGMYDLATGVRLSAYDPQGELLPDGLVQLVEK